MHQWQIKYDVKETKKKAPSAFIFHFLFLLSLCLSFFRKKEMITMGALAYKGPLEGLWLFSGTKSSETPKDAYPTSHAYIYIYM